MSHVGKSIPQVYSVDPVSERSEELFVRLAYIPVILAVSYFLLCFLPVQEEFVPLDPFVNHQQLRTGEVVKRVPQPLPLDEVDVPDDLPYGVEFGTR